MIDVQFLNQDREVLHEAFYKDLHALKQHLVDLLSPQDLLDTIVVEVTTHSPQYEVTIPHGLRIEPVYKQLDLRNDFFNEDEWDEYRRREELGLIPY